MVGDCMGQMVEDEVNRLGGGDANQLMISHDLGVAC